MTALQVMNFITYEITNRIVTGNLWERYSPFPFEPKKILNLEFGILQLEFKKYCCIHIQ